jgi:hypothetical protein
MNPLFDRYFLVLAGRLTRDHWVNLSQPTPAGCEVAILRWPPDESESTFGSIVSPETTPVALRSSS